MADLTVVLNMYSLPFPNIVNKIRVDVAPQNNKSNIVATETDAVAGHPARIWTFPGLPRTNYNVTMNEIDANGNAGNNLAYFDVVPDQNVYVVRNDEQLTVDTTPGLTSGSTSINFDGGQVSVGTSSSLIIPYQGNLSADAAAFTLGGIPNVGDSVKVDVTYDSNDTVTSTLAVVTQSNPSAKVFTVSYTGVPAVNDQIQIYGTFDGVSFDVSSNNAFSTLDTILYDITARLNMANVTASYSGNVVTITGNTSVAGSSIIKHGKVVNTNSFSVNLAAASTTLSELVEGLYQAILAKNPNTSRYNSGSYDGVKTNGYSKASVLVTVTKKQQGTNNRPDYRGWNINPERRNQPGTMIRDVEYSWDSVSGLFTLLIPGDKFLTGEPYNIDFDPQIIKAGGSVPPTGGGTPVVTGKFACRVITTSSTVLLTDFGNKIILEPVANYIELTFPDITTVTDCLPLDIAAYGNTDFTVKLKFGGTKKWLYGTEVYICRGESMRVHNFIRTANAPEWRFDRLCGSWGIVGRIVELDSIQSGTMNALLLNGAIVSNAQYARLWQYVASLPAPQRKNYSDGITTFFSTLNGSSFRLPDRTGLYARQGSTEDAGTKWRQQMEKHKHIFPYGNNPSALTPPFGQAGFTSKYGITAHDNDNDYWYTNDGSEYAGAAQLNAAGIVGTETRPNSYSINKYVIV